jgi:hypothetical protein
VSSLNEILSRRIPILRRGGVALWMERKEGAEIFDRRKTGKRRLGFAAAFEKTLADILEFGDQLPKL